jgi:hypothetical protein
MPSFIAKKERSSGPGTGRWALLLLGVALLGVGAVAIIALLVSGDAALATLAQWEGAVSRDSSEATGAWRGVTAGDEFFHGDGVRTAADGSARLALIQGGVLSLGPNTLVRFAPEQKQGGATLVVEEGQAELAATAEALTLNMGQGKTRLSAGARLSLKAKDGAVEYEVRRGSARISARGRELVLTTGTSTAKAKIDVSGVVLTVDVPDAKPPPPPPPPTVPEVAPDSVVSELLAKADAAAPRRSQFTVRAGESFVVHDGSPPTAVGLRFGGVCAEGGVVELMQGRRVKASAAGEAKANLLVPAGSFRYRVRCVSKDGFARSAAADGSVRVVADSGSAALPKSPPPTVVDLDGRSYRVLYQNVLPDVTVRWRGAPSKGPYELILAGGNAARTIKTKKPEYIFDSGEIDEGSYSLVFQVAGDTKQQSRATDLSVRFDNASPSARLMEPKSGSFTGGSTVRVAGVAADGWRVSVGDTDIPLDRQRRFSANWSVPPEQDGLAVRLAHPNHGIHYYLRKGR